MTDIAVREPLEGEVVNNDMARLNITWSGTNGDLPDLVPFHVDDAEMKRMATEAIESGYIPGIDAGTADLSDFVVDRFPANEQVRENRVFIRPKTPFGVQ